MLLSPRSLIFLDLEVVWHCKEAEWLEEFDFEHPKIAFRWGNERDDAGLTMENYPNLVRQYTLRQLNFERDIVEAFSGVLDAIPGEFFWGIPYSNFGSYLGWTASSERAWVLNERRDCGLSIPSWSWFGWRGTVSLREGREPVTSTLAVYCWWDGSLERICTPTLSTGPSTPRDAIKWRDATDWT
jgi:hypothetical protein